MSAPNFYYKNRCIVITDDDYINGNIPEESQMETPRIEGSQYYTSVPVNVLEGYLEKGEYEPSFFRVVMTAGRYGDGVLDYLPTDFTVEDYVPMARYGYVCTIEELVNHFRDADPSVSKRKYRELIGKRGKGDYEEWYEGVIKRVEDYLRAKDKELCDKICDRIMEAHGYKEYTCTGVMSNGEATYAPIDNPLNLRKPVVRRQEQ